MWGTTPNTKRPSENESGQTKEVATRVKFAHTESGTHWKVFFPNNCENPAAGEICPRPRTLDQISRSANVGGMPELRFVQQVSRDPACATGYYPCFFRVEYITLFASQPIFPVVSTRETVRPLAEDNGLFDGGVDCSSLAVGETTFGLTHGPPVSGYGRRQRSDTSQLQGYKNVQP